jgi:hypothetical protein
LSDCVILMSEKISARCLSISGSQSHVYVVWHYYCYVKFVTSSAILTTAGQHDVPSDRWQDPPQPCHEGDEVRREILLQMGKIAAVELHARLWHADTSLISKAHGKA